MILKQRKNAFVQLGKILGQFRNDQPWPGFKAGLSEQEFNDFNDLIKRVKNENGWFTEDQLRFAVGAWSDALKSDKIDQWLAGYNFESDRDKSIAVIMAGNIPLVGFHDFLSVIIAGYRFQGKLSSDDRRLLPTIADMLIKIEPEMEDRILFKDRQLKDFDAVIATGSNNTSRYFESYFGQYPNIIRKNRTSVAVLDDSESEMELEELAEDIFRYFGLGCRNVSKLYVPQGYDLNKVINALYPYKEIINHNKYANNYDYIKAIYLMNQEPDLLENGFLIFKKDTSLHSPLGTIFYEEYMDESAVYDSLSDQTEQIQCVVSKKHIPFGKAQRPELWDYADNVNTLDFLAGLKGA